MPLPDLSAVYHAASSASARLQKCDADLPEPLKARLAPILGIRFGQFSAERVITPRVFVPFDWFFIGAVLVPLYKALMQYKTAIEHISSSRLLDKAAFEGARSGNLDVRFTTGISALPAAAYNDGDRQFLKRFLTDYDWWHGSKTIDRGDFHASSLLQAANVLAASASFLVEEIVPALASHPEIVDELLGNVREKATTITLGKNPDLYRGFSDALKGAGFISPK